MERIDKTLHGDNNSYKVKHSEEEVIVYGSFDHKVTIPFSELREIVKEEIGLNP